MSSLLGFKIKRFFGKHEFQKLDLFRQTFFKQDFSYIEIKKGWINQNVFVSCDFSGTRFKDVELDNTVFIGCKMSFTDFGKSSLCSTQFEDCNLRYAKFGDAHTETIQFRSCDLTQATFGPWKYEHGWLDPIKRIVGQINSITIGWEQPHYVLEMVDNSHKILSDRKLFSSVEGFVDYYDGCNNLYEDGKKEIRRIAEYLKNFVPEREPPKTQIDVEALSSKLREYFKKVNEIINKKK